MTSKGIKAHWWVLTALLAVGLAFGVAFYLTSDNTGFQDRVPVNLTLGTEISLLTSAVWVAEEKKFFVEEGLNVTIRGFDSGRLSFQSMLSGDVDLSTVAPTPIMFSSFDRNDFAVLATFVYSDDDVKVIGRLDRGIQTAKDLIGKRVGTPAGTTGQFVLNTFLVHNEIPASNITEVSLSPSKLPDSLESGDVDAIVIWEPHANKARKRLQENAVWLPSSNLYRETFNLMVMKAFASRHPQAMEEVLRALYKATTFIQTNKEASQEIVSRRLGLDRLEMAELWDDFVFEISLDHSLLVTLEDEARWAIESRLTQRGEIPDYLDFIYPDALRRAKPQAVTLIY